MFPDFDIDDIALKQRRYELEREEGWKEVSKHIQEIDAFNFHEDWNVRIIPPFGCAYARFYVSKKDNPDKRISVYLDMHDRLGFYGSPYWEAYDFSDDGPYRYDMNDVNGLMEYITTILDGGENNANT